MPFRQTEHGPVPLTEEEVMKIEKARTRWQRRKELLRTKNGLMKKPALWNYEPHGKEIVKKKYGITDSEEEEDKSEIYSLKIDYTDLRGDMTEEEVNNAIAFYNQQRRIRELAEEEKKKALEQAKAKEKREAQFEEQRKNPTDLFPVAEALELLRNSADGNIRRKAHHSIPRILPNKRKYDYYLMLNESDDETVRENELYAELSCEIQKLWTITPVWRLYTFSFKRSLISETCPKLMVQFDRECNSRWMDSIPIPDITKGDSKIYNRRVNRFSIHANWHLLLNNLAVIEEHEVAAGDGLDRFLESTSRKQHDKWTPNYQSLTIMTQIVSDELDPMNQDPIIYRIYCLVARENNGRDIDSKSYLLVRPRYFDKNVGVVNEALKEDTLKIWITRMAKQKKGRTFCGSTDFRITTSVREVQQIFENKNS